MIRTLLFTLAVCLLCACNTNSKQLPTPNIMNSEKVNIGPLLALYPRPITVVGAYVDGKPNWLLVGHTGIIGHDRIMLSMSQRHYTNSGIKENRRLSINIVSRELLPKADYVGSVSGSNTDKSNSFAYHVGEYGTPVIDASPLTMECEVVSNYVTNGFDNFICRIVNTYASNSILTNGKPDYNKLKPVLFDFSTYTYIATGEVVGHCLNLDKAPSMCAKQAMQADGIVRLSKIEVHPQYLNEYMNYATEVGEISLRTESGVLSMYAMQQKSNPCLVTILETYASQEAYEKHIASAHFQKYKQSTLHTVKHLELLDQQVLNPANKINNFVE